MAKYYIQVEAVNLMHAVYDTHDISTIRGGSFLLLDVIRRLADHFADRLEKITTAASQGLFEVKEGIDLGSIEVEILLFLHGQTAGHVTFLVAVEPDIPGNFSGVLERLQAQIRRKQWRMPTIAIPEYAEAEAECFLDGWRPGTVDYAGETSAKISAATKFRREQSWELKRDLLRRIVGDQTYDAALNAKDLGELAAHADMGVLDGKIAYIHIDGNSFGRIKRALCTTPEIRRAFDKQIQTGCRKPFLRELLNWIDDDFLTQDRNGKQARRLELLLWGGDEMILIVPAWRGWQVLDLFYEHARNLTFQGVELSHRAAIVFCHHNTPILQIRRIADELLAQARGNIKTRVAEAVATGTAFAGAEDEKKEHVTEWLASHRYGNAIHYLALESFDMLRGSLSDFLKVYYRKPIFDKMLLYADEMQVMLDDLKLIQANVSRGKVLKVIGVLQHEYLFSFTPTRPDELKESPSERFVTLEEVVGSLDKKAIPVALRSQFETQLEVTLPAVSAVTVDEQAHRWTITAVNTSYDIYLRAQSLHVYRQRDEKELKKLGDEVLAAVVPGRVSEVSAALERVLALDYDHWYWIADLWDYVPEWKV